MELIEDSMKVHIESGNGYKVTIRGLKHLVEGLLESG